MRLSRGKIGLALVAGALISALVIVGVPQLRWRAQVVALYATGQIPDLEFSQLLAYMSPGSEQTMTRLIDTRNPYAVIRNFRTSEADVEAGHQLFHEHCAACHGAGGTGGSSAPAFINHDYVHGDSDWAIFRTIHYGLDGKGMPAIADLAERDTWRLVTYLRAIDTSVADDVADDRAITAMNPVTAAELAATTHSADDWLTYSGSHNGTRHSDLAQINKTNVQQIRVSWLHQFNGEPMIEASPIVRNGVMFVPVPPCSVQALDASTGRTIWRWTCSLKVDRPGEHSATTSRGVALLGGTIYAATWDARIVALDAATGDELWQSAATEDVETYYISGAPLAFGNMIVTGVATREVGRGFIVAFDALTGKERWRFMAIPEPGTVNGDTWAGDSWQRGGAPTWLTGSYDAGEDLLYWGVGNPKPDYDAEVRAGDNLYSNSVVALRASSGELAWHFQFSPGDNHDWDSAQIPVLVENTSGDGSDKRMLWANRNGYFYILDRRTGEFLHGVPFVQQTWNAGLDINGRPVPLTNLPAGKEGRLVYPGNVGGTNWWSPSYDSSRNLMYVPVLEQGMVFFPSFRSWPQPSGKSFYTAVRALDATSGRRVWEYRMPARIVDNRIGGLLSSAGGLVFGSDQGTFFALDADSGAELWSIRTGGAIVAAPVTFTVDGMQTVAIASGHDILAFSLPPAVIDAAGE